MSTEPPRSEGDEKPPQTHTDAASSASTTPPAAVGPEPSAEPAPAGPSPAAKRPGFWRRLARGSRPFLAELFLIGAVYASLRAWQLRTLAHDLVPELDGVSVEGSALSLAQKRGEPVLVYFWADWCSACKLQQPVVDGLIQGHQVITVAAHSGDEQAVAEALRTRGLSWPTIADRDGRLADAFGVKAFPTSFFIDREGRISSAEVGYTTGPGMRLRLWWAGR